MKRILLALIFIGHCTVHTFSQQLSSEQHSLFNEGKRYSIGVNTQFAVDGLFDQTAYTPLEVLIRKRAKKNQAFRARLKGMVWETNRITAEDSLLTQQAQLALAFGYEWNRSLGKKFGYTYGFDLESHWGKNKAIRNFIGPSETFGSFIIERTDLTRIHSVSLLPFAGFSYKVLPNIYISFEVRMGIASHNEKMRSNVFFLPIGRPDDYVGHSSGKYQKKDWEVNFRPYSGIFVNLIL